MRLRRELDKVLALQTQIDGVEKSIAEVKQSITSPDISVDSIIWLRNLEKTHDTLSTQAHALYASLNIEKSFPELQNLPLDFVRTLLMMRDLKINIRKRAVGSFYEWENLDRAVGGMREALGQDRWRPPFLQYSDTINRYQATPIYKKGHLKAPARPAPFNCKIQWLLC